MKRLSCLAILTLLVGCGTKLGAEARARSECFTLTETEFQTLWNFASLDRDYGGTKEESLWGVSEACWHNAAFDRDSECRACMTAIIEGVW